MGVYHSIDAVAIYINPDSSTSDYTSHDEYRNIDLLRLLNHDRPPHLVSKYQLKQKLLLINDSASREEKMF